MTNHEDAPWDKACQLGNMRPVMARFALDRTEDLPPLEHAQQTGVVKQSDHRKNDNHDCHRPEHCPLAPREHLQRTHLTNARTPRQFFPLPSNEDDPRTLPTVDVSHHHDIDALRPGASALTAQGYPTD